MIYNLLITAYKMASKIENAFAVKTQMVNSGVDPDTVTYNELICGLAEVS